LELKLAEIRHILRVEENARAYVQRRGLGGGSLAANEMRRKMARSVSLQVIPIMIVAPARYSYHARRVAGLENYRRDTQRFPRALYFAGNFVGRSDSRNLTRTIEIAQQSSRAAISAISERFHRAARVRKIRGGNRIAGCMMDAGTGGNTSG